MKLVAAMVWGWFFIAAVFAICHWDKAVNSPPHSIAWVILMASVSGCLVVFYLVRAIIEAKP